MGLFDELGPIGGLVGGIIGNNEASGARDAAGNLINQGVSAIQDVKTPEDLQKQIYYNQYKSAGQLTPAQEQAINSGPSAEGAVKANPNLVNAQMQALNTLKGVSQTGMSSTDRARYNQMQQQANAQAEGQRQAALQNFAQRGLSGSGNELMAQLQASQNAANQANQGGLQIAGQAQQNALNALGQYGQQAGAMNTQQFGQQAQTAAAQDALNRFNVQNQMQQQARNVAGQNQAQQYNLQNNQNISNSNVGQSNQELLRQKNAEQQLFSDAMQRAGALSNASFTGAGAENQMANQIAGNAANMGAGIGGVLAGGMNGGFGDLGKGISGLFGGGGGGLGAVTGTGATAADYNALPDVAALALAHGGMATMPMISNLMTKGGHVPGRAKVKGDSYANDTVPAKLSAGEIVIPRSITQNPNAPELAKHFVAGIQKDK